VAAREQGGKIMITVANVRTHAPDARPAIYVGRATRGRKGSPLGNPFKIGKDGTRDEVIAKYAAWLDEQLAEAGSAASLELARIRAVWLEHGGIVLACWCAPERCHAEVIRDRLERR
jgi:hypothetical protein